MTAQEPASRPRECRFCAAPLTPHQAARGGVCAAPACESRRVQEASRAVFQRNWNAYVTRQRQAVEANAPALAAAARALGTRFGEIALGVVPRQEAPLVPLPVPRREAFAEHLAAIVGEAFAREPSPVDVQSREASERPELPLMAAACASCQGKCCVLGGQTHAFLKVETIELFRTRNPDATAEATIAHFLGRLPERSVEHSCVYHTDRGCVLARDERADICNRYHCNPQTQLLRRYRSMPAAGAIIIAVEDDAGPAMGLFDEATGWRPFDMDAAVGDADARSVERVRQAALAQLPRELPSAAIPPGPACAWCGQPIDPHRAATTRCCGRPHCEKRRIAELAAALDRRRASEQEPSADA